MLFISLDEKSCKGYTKAKDIKRLGFIKSSALDGIKVYSGGSNVSISRY
jgi:hypothetical protein